MNVSTLDAVPLPDSDADLKPPSPTEVERQARGVLATVLAPGAKPSQVQQTVLEATFHSMTGHRPDLSGPTSTPNDDSKTAPPPKVGTPTRSTALRWCRSLRLRQSSIWP